MMIFWGVILLLFSSQFNSPLSSLFNSSLLLVPWTLASILERLHRPIRKLPSNLFINPLNNPPNNSNPSINSNSRLILDFRESRNHNVNIYLF